MPNTEVKLLHAESSWWETACEGRKLPRFFYSGLAQLVEHLTVNQVVVSSSLTTGVFLWRVVREAEGAWLETMYTGFTCIKGSNPLLSVVLHSDVAT